MPRSAAGTSRRDVSTSLITTRRYAPVMHVRTTDLLQHLDGTRKQLADAFGAVPVARRDERPAAGQWSAGDVLSHLAMIEASVVEILQKKLRRAMAAGSLSPAGGDSRRWHRLQGVLLDEELKIKAPDFVVPDGSQLAAEAWRSLQESRPQLRQVLMAADGKNTETVVARHVLLGVLTFEEWLGFVGYHEQRHAAQILRTCVS